MPNPLSTALTERLDIAYPVCQAGMGFIARGAPAKVYENAVDGHVVVIEFDSVERATSAHDSDAYQAALKLLGNGADGIGGLPAGEQAADLAALGVSAETAATAAQLAYQPIYSVYLQYPCDVRLTAPMLGFDDALLQYLSPLGWEHINLTGDYVWRQNRKIGDGLFRPLRTPEKP